MNEFEWRRQLRDLREPVTPRRDLWLAIEPALAAPATRPAAPARRRTASPVWLLAASFAGITLLAVGLGLQPQRLGAGQPLTTATRASWRPDDPRLAGAAIELDAASLELRQAMRQAPDSPALQRLLRRTQQQQSWLHHLDRAS